MARERPPLEEMTLRQLRKVAAELEISRYSRMRKSQLLADIQ
ncbi:MAG: Rho termination factor N-terminal domain-containing protein, partial [Pseudanabaena sp.]